MGIVISQCQPGCFQFYLNQNQFESNRQFLLDSHKNTQVQEEFKIPLQLFVKQYSNQNYFEKQFNSGTQQHSSKKIIYQKGKFLFIGEVINKQNGDASGLVIFQKNQYRFKGTFKNKLAEGQGTFMNKNRTIVLKGVWKDGSPIGEDFFQLILGDVRYKVKFTYKRSNLAKSKLKSGQRRASGAKKIPIQQIEQEKSMIFSEVDLKIKNKEQLYIGGVQIQFPNHIVYRGQLNSISPASQNQQGKFQQQVYKTIGINGIGQLIFPDQNYYRGEFLGGKMHGKGQFYFNKTGHKYVGQYQNGIKNGYGKYYFSQTQYKEGIWIGGQLQEKIQ